MKERATIGVKMVDTGLPTSFVLRVLELARESEGIDDLLQLWADAPDTAERQAVEAELGATIDDRDGGAGDFVIDSTDAAGELLEQRRRFKARLRRLIAERGGVSAVARRAEMPQPSLSRLLNSMSEPRSSTLHRLADAMDLTVADLCHEARQIQIAPDSVFRVQAGSFLVAAENMKIAITKTTA
ncbi:MAG: helix-turn-helix transcriptional regulator [Deltaproteobacteria bacterium]|nr:helix-turn-helix transcriptional regulator [Deltaproteobacteria bacterium]